MREATKAAADDPLIGRRFGGKYTIERLIGRGGVGLVYLAQQAEDEPQVVLKLLAPDWIQDPEAVARFEREAKRLGALRHPNIVRMHDYGHQDGRAYLVMEYLKGDLLRDFVASRGQLALDEFVPIAAQVLKGIGHAHSRELMVRDVKPANIMLCTRKGRSNFVKILDFGLAKLLKDEHPVTEEHVLGTVGYLAPEAIKGEDVDLRVDVYALGVLFYFMLVGKLPFSGQDSATVFYKTINEAAPPISQVLPAGHSVSPGLQALIHRCLEKDPNRRPQDANAIVEELIDVVPASMFRLPRIKRVEPGIPSRAAGFGNTGLVELVGHGAMSAPHRPVSGRKLPPPPPPPASVPELPIPTAVEASDHGPIAIEIVEQKSGLGAKSWAAAGAMVALLGAFAVYSFTRDSPPPAVAGNDSAPARSEADSKHAEGRAQEKPAADDDATIESQLAKAADLEREGNISGAIEVYREVLDVSDEHADARNRLDRLTARAAGQETEQDVKYGAVEINALPEAQLSIDGEDMGTTPFEGKLPVGTHSVHMTARGHQSWQSTIEIAEAGNAAISARLTRRGRRGRGRPKTTGATQPTASPEAEPAAPATPSPPATADSPPDSAPPAAKPTPKKKKKKKSVFLPTSNGSGKSGGVFLPTKD